MTIYLNNLVLEAMKYVFCKSASGNSLGGVGTGAEGICDTCKDKLFDLLKPNIGKFIEEKEKSNLGWREKEKLDSERRG